MAATPAPTANLLALALSSLSSMRYFSNYVKSTTQSSPNRTTNSIGQACEASSRHYLSRSLATTGVLCSKAPMFALRLCSTCKKHPRIHIMSRARASLKSTASRSRRRRHALAVRLHLCKRRQPSQANTVKQYLTTGDLTATKSPLSSKEGLSRAHST